MKVITNIQGVVKTLLLLLLIGFQSCGTYNSLTSDIESDLYNGNFDKAVTAIEKNKFLGKDRNQLLYLLEKGKVEHLRGKYTASNELLEQAYILIDDRIKTNTGQAIAAQFTNPMATPYKGEDFEKVTLHYYKALNYFMLGRPNEALVEAKRINIKLYELNENYTENKNKYSEDAFSQILQGIIYESVGDINNAFIAYRNAEEIYTKNDGEYFGVAMPEQLKKDLLRTSRQMGFIQEYNNYRTRFTIPVENSAAKNTPQDYNEPKPQGEAVIFWENGIGPAKDQVILTASGVGGVFYATYMEDGIVNEIFLPIPLGTDMGINAIAIPKYNKRGSYYNKAELIVNGTPQQLDLAQDFYPIARQTLKDRMLRETANTVARFAVKKASSAGLQAIGKEFLGEGGGDILKLGADIAGAVTEKADTRNWQTLPATISYTRVPLKEGINKFVIKKYGPMGVDTDTINIPYKHGLQIINYYDLGRTQVIPATKTEKPEVYSEAERPAQKNAATLVPDNTGPEKLYNATLVDEKIAAKYDTWQKAGEGIYYRVSYEIKELGNKKFYAKTVTLRSEREKDADVTFAISEQPFDANAAEVSREEYYTLQAEKGVVTDYFTVTEKLQPNVEKTSLPVYHTTPDFYIKLFKVNG